MNRFRITPTSSTEGSVHDPLAAACDDGRTRSRRFFGNTTLKNELEVIQRKASDLVAVYGDEPAFDAAFVEYEIDFQGFSEAFADAVQEGVDAGAEIAVNMTPGRKFMSAIALQSGL